MSAERGRPASGLVPALLAGLALRRTGLIPPRRSGDAAAADAPRGSDRRSGEEAARETADVNVRNAALVMAGLALAVLAVVAGMVWLRDTITSSQRRALPALTPQQTTRLTPPAPNLQPDPDADIERARAAARAGLSGYGYLDPERTRARIPIDRAMELSVGRPLDPVDGARGAP